MKESYQIQLITSSKIEELVALEKKCFSLAWSSKEYEHFLQQLILLQNGDQASFESILQKSANVDSLGFVLLVSSCEQILAYTSVLLQPRIHEMELYNIAVAEEFRRQGLAKSLLSYTVTTLAQYGITNFFLEVRASNTPAIRLYESLAFSQYAVRKKYYADSDEDGLLYQLCLDTL